MNDNSGQGKSVDEMVMDKVMNVNYTLVVTCLCQKFNQQTLGIIQT